MNGSIDIEFRYNGQTQRVPNTKGLTDGALEISLPEGLMIELVVVSNNELDTTHIGYRITDNEGETVL